MTFESRRGGPICSVVIPAHNEEAVIGRLLDALASGAAEGELEIHVVCNGCSDDTASTASSYAGVRVHELSQPSKTAALNAGDRAAGDVFPRLYVDADVFVNLQTVRTVAAVLSDDSVLAAAPRPEVALEGRPRIVRGFYAAFMRTGWMTEEPIGSGFYGLSRLGRLRFDRFPNLINDDLFVRSLFSNNERSSLSGVSFRIEAPHSTWALVRSKARVDAGTRQYLERYGSSPTGRPGEQQDHRPALVSLDRWRRIASSLLADRNTLPWQLIEEPRLWPAVTSYYFVRLAARVLAVASGTSNLERRWNQDRTSRDRGKI